MKESELLAVCGVEQMRKDVLHSEILLPEMCLDSRPPTVLEKQDSSGPRPATSQSKRSEILLTVQKERNFFFGAAVVKPRWSVCPLVRISDLKLDLTR